jgi:hypothetical protein
MQESAFVKILTKLLSPKGRKFIIQMTNCQIFKKEHIPQSWLPTFSNVCVLTDTCALSTPPSLHLKGRYRNQWLSKVCKQGTIHTIFITYIMEDQVLLKQMPRTILFFSPRSQIYPRSHMYSTLTHDLATALSSFLFRFTLALSFTCSSHLKMAAGWRTRCWSQFGKAKKRKVNISLF